MNETIIENAINYIEELFQDNTDGHDANHSLRVYNNAMNIAANTNIPLNALINLLAEYFAEQGGRRRQAGACQGVQHSYAEYNAINIKVF